MQITNSEARLRYCFVKRIDKVDRRDTQIDSYGGVHQSNRMLVMEQLM